MTSCFQPGGIGHVGAGGGFVAHAASITSAQRITPRVYFGFFNDVRTSSTKP